MKGVIFNAFFEMVEQKMGNEMLEQIIEGAQLPHLGSYTAAGSYPDEEMFALIHQLHQKTDIEVPILLETFGKYAFHFLHQGYIHFFKDVHDAFDLLSSVHHYIHVEVKKLYTDAILPAFTVEERTAQRLVLRYESERGLSDLARGLLIATLEHYNEKFLLEEKFPTDNKCLAVFTIIRI